MWWELDGWHAHRRALTSAQYTASYSYDTLGRLTSAPLGSYTYGDPNHLDAATSVGSIYTASYDAADDLTYRSLTDTADCLREAQKAAGPVCYAEGSERVSA